MPTWNVRLFDGAYKRIREKIAEYAADPAAHGAQVKRLQNSPFHRIRVGDYRAIFDIEADTITVLDVGHRKDIYR